jgi:hypothetical protein
MVANETHVLLKYGNMAKNKIMLFPGKNLIIH